MVNLFRRRRWLGAILWAAAILVVSSLPSPTLGPPLFPNCDKLAHFIEYMIFGLALRYWAPGGLAVGAAGLAFAALDEIHQRFIPGREMSFWDFAADAAGLAVGYLLLGRKMRAGAASTGGPGAGEKD
jgi:VanZ family protein